MTRQGLAAPNRVAIYCRISLDRTGEGLGVERQEDECRALAKARGWDVAEVYIDNDISAWSGKRRPAFERLTADIEAGNVDGVVAWHLDRIVRRMKDLERILDTVESDLLPAPVRFAFVTAGDIDLNTASGRMLARILAAVAAQESEHKASRVKSARAQEAKAGKVNASLGYGYNKDHSINASEAAIVREVAERFLAGETLYRIANDLNRRAVPTPGSGTWTHWHVKRHAMNLPYVEVDDAATTLVGACMSKESTEAAAMARMLRAAGGQQENGTEWTAAAVRNAPLLAAACTEALDFAATARAMTLARVPAGEMHWRPANLRTMIRRGALCGWREWSPGKRGGSGELVAEGSWSPILTKETTERIRKMTEHIEKRPGRKPKHLLSGILVCGKCGRGLGGHRDKDGLLRYGCSKQPGLTACGRLGIIGDPVDEMVTETVLDALADAGLRTRRGMRRGLVSMDAEKADRELAEVTADRQFYAAQVGSGLLSRDEYATILEGLTARQKAAEAILGRFSPDQEAAFRGVPTDRKMVEAWWEAADMERRQAVVSALIERIEIAPSKPGANSFDADRVGTPVWRL